MSARLGLPFLAAVLLLSVATGALTAPSARATTNWGLWVNPGASSNYLTCGWHSTCFSPFTWGNALDWNNDPYTHKNVYWRSWATADTGSGTMAYAYPYDATGTCYGAGAKGYDLGWTERGRVVWLHTQLGAGAPTAYVQGSWIGSFTSAGPMGTTVETDKSGCPFDGPHLH